MTLPKTSFNKFGIEFSYSNAELRKTSLFGKSKNALAAINGSFFDMDKGGSVTYLEINDTVISRTRTSDLKWAKADSLVNGAIVLTTGLKVSIESASSDKFYELSTQEASVLLSGPLLLLDSEKMKLPQMKFTTKRHPRTCLCISNDAVVFITIDGRTNEAEGMNLFEVQKLLLSIGCVDAINLDGGGSTTMWVKDKGIVNFPSDKLGERPVSNALLLIHK